MIRLRHKLFVYAMRGLDPVILIAAVLVVLQFGHPQSSTQALHDYLWKASRPGDALGLIVLLAGWLFIYNAFVHYDVDRFTSLSSELVDVTGATSAAALLLLAVSTTFGFERLDNQVVLLVWTGSTVATWISRLTARGFLMAVRRSGYNYRHVIVVGFNPDSLRLAERIDASPELGCKITGFVTEGSEEAARLNRTTSHPVLGSLPDLQRILEQGTVDEIAVCLPVREHLTRIFEIVQLAQELGVVARLFPGGSGAKLVGRFQVERFGGDYMLTLFRQRALGQLLAKRIMDAALSALMLAATSPLLVLTAIAIKLTSAGPVLFVQKRVGMNRRTFNFYKFRSMYVDAEARRAALAHLNEMDGPVFKMKNDPRVTPLGRLLRMTSIDELPQLVNVLSGQMSLVGPRPPLPAEVEQYEWLYRKRLSIKPGITCLWQVSGRSHLSFKQWMELDQRYIDNWSLWLDLKILFQTIPAVLSFKGAS